MGVLDNNTLLGASAASDYEIEQSLRFDDGSTSYLKRTPSTASNRRTWTFSAWVKRGSLPSNVQTIFMASNPSSAGAMIRFNADKLVLLGYNGGVSYTLATNRLFRDPSAWYHIVLAVDTTQGTAANRLKMYVNGVQETSFSTATYPSQNLETYVNSTNPHYIGVTDESSLQLYFDGYIGEINLIDGLALTPDSFGETGDYGEWLPSRYAGAYGTNGFYLPFKQDYSVEGFSTVIYEGTGATQYIGGTGFSPSWTWFKRRSGADTSTAYDVVRGVTKALSPNNTDAESTIANTLTAFSADGFTLGSAGQVNANNQTYVAWSWDMGGTTASNTDGTITSSVRANPAYGQSIITWTPSNNSGTVGHGLDSAPELWITKNRASADNWLTFYTVVDGTLDYMLLNLTNAAGSSSLALPTSTVFSNDGYTSSQNLVTYAFHSVTGYSKFSSYEGTGGTHAITLGFSPAFVMIKNADAAGDWTMWDNTRNPNNPVTQMLRANTTGAEETKTDREPSFTATGFTIGDANADTNASGQTYVYMAFADTREYAYWLDQSGNNNDWTSEGGLTESDVMLDSPTNNFAVCNILTDSGNRSVKSEGNLRSTAAYAGWEHSPSSISMSAGKWYSEMLLNTAGEGIAIYACVTDATNTTAINYDSNNKLVGYKRQSGNKVINGTVSSYGAGYNAGDIIGMALDMDAKTLTFYKNNASQGTISSIPYVNAYFDAVVTDDASVTFNFGQDSSFAGAKTAQGNQDGNDIGDFYYAPPSGFLALCTKNLDTTTVTPSENFNTVIYTGNATARNIDVGFQSDFTWVKARSLAYSNRLVDSVRGATKTLESNNSNAEITESTGVTAFNSTGFALGTAGGYNQNNATYVAWNWKAGGSASSNTDGTITSTVSANVDAGFSIVGWTANGTDGLGVGHGLSSAPELIIYKTRNTVNEWYTWLNALVDSSQDYVRLNSTAAKVDINSAVSGVPSPTLISKFGFANTNTMIAYCFHSVDGYSKVGSYIGNGSTDGTFVHLGFRPAYVMIKRTDSAGNGWGIKDDARFPSNVMNGYLFADSSSAEGTASSLDMDFTSNGFKWRGTSSDGNASGGTYIYLAFAESPFKNSNAR